MIDAHLHLWDPQHLRYDWLSHVPNIAGAHTPDDWGRANTGVGRAVFVQSDCEPGQALAEVDWVSGLRHPALDIIVIVAFAPLELGERALPHLEALRTRPKVRGVRRSVQNEADGFITDAAHIDGLIVAAASGLTIDVCARARQLPRVIEALTALFHRVPEARVVLDHLGKPDIAAHGKDIHGDDWATHIGALAQFPGVSAKISGLVTEDKWDARRPEVLKAYIHHALTCFGPDRLMFGGDWPVVDLACGYGQWIETFDHAIAHLDGAAHHAIREGTASKFYTPAARSAADKEFAA